MFKSCGGGKIPKESYLRPFKEYGCIGQQRLWITNIRCIISITARITNLSYIIQYLYVTMDLNTNGKLDLIPDVYLNNSVTEICNALIDNIGADVTRNGFVEVSQTDKKSTGIPLPPTHPRSSSPFLRSINQ